MRIPIKEIKELAQKLGLTHCVVFGIDTKQQHVATYGDTIIHCDQAAHIGNKFKEILGWNENLQIWPSRVKKLQIKVKELETENKRLKEVAESYKNAIDRLGIE